MDVLMGILYKESGRLENTVIGVLLLVIEPGNHMFIQNAFTKDEILKRPNPTFMAF